MIFDLIFLLIFAWAAYRGYTKGLISQAATLAALVLGIFGAVRFSGLTSAFIMRNTEFTGEYLPLISFIITFIIIVILVHFAARLIDKLLDAVALGIANRIFGVVFSILKSAFIISIVLVIINTIHFNRPFLPEEKINKSLLYVPLSGLAPAIFPYLHFERQDKPFPPDKKDDIKV